MADDCIDAALDATLASLGARIASASGLLGAEVRWDWPEVRHERARHRGLAPRGRATASGAGRLLECADGWVAVQLPRPEDTELLDAWFAIVNDLDGRGHRPSDAPSPDPWPSVRCTVAGASGAALVDGAALLGLAVSRLNERDTPSPGGVTVHGSRPWDTGRVPRVLDLSALWAGPLCGGVLAAAGAEVTKVESTSRPDGARIGDPALFDRLNSAKVHRRVDLATTAGRSELARLIGEADVVIESSRPRALEHLGIRAASEVERRDGPGIWVSITGYGRCSPRVAFGDDAAVAGGVVGTTDDGPMFAGDAVADPLSGLAAAATTLELLTTGQGGLVEVAMADVAASVVISARTPTP